ncbi:sigma-54 interaction domain-containing protein [Papillibacter cinnamivorans]|uniref:HTH-type transcriptional regulatory protein TyrR n=1 Tax=Papillibacter cinnamivorans DSM 12816 TaxID=1122930 RepID=A0A1W1YNR8_9FIRM|nr:sigma 54-interacting transcriptional regulator [Papillibacter cinnamivorans]SMC37860.1 PAS domain S-box-containing protein [Papillibacter cinnamivorans DSM 12816]
MDGLYCRPLLCDENGTVLYSGADNSAYGVSVGDKLALKDAVNAQDGILMVSDTIVLCRADITGFRGYVGYSCDSRLHEDVIAELRNKNRECDAIFESSHDGIVVADADGLYTRVNSNYAKITGIPWQDVLGHTAQELVDNGIISDSATLHVLHTGKSFSFSQSFKTGRQSIVTGSPILSEEGKIISVVTNVRDMTEIYKLRKKVQASREKLEQYSKVVEKLTQEKLNPNGIVYKSKQMETLLETALRFSKVDTTVLVTGESGVGKEMVVDFIHRNSKRSREPFFKINCGAIPDALLESELFGYEAGAFTGAKKGGNAGLFELANHGTILLDEIGELSLPLQVKLLRLVEQKEFYRVGGHRLIRVDVRIIAATNRNLAEMVDQKLFRADLFYRLAVLKLYIPPLRERREDILPLALHFLWKFNELSQSSKVISPRLYPLLINHDWNGNVRELENLMERLVLICDQNEIGPEYLPTEMLSGRNLEGIDVGDLGDLTYQEARDKFERNFFSHAIQTYRTARKTAEKLEIDHSTVVKKAAKYGLTLSPKEDEAEYGDKHHQKEAFW